MMKCRVFKKDNGQVIFNYIPTHKQDDIEKLKIPEPYQKYPYIILDESELPISDSKTGNYHEMIYFDGSEIKQDKEWKACLMPTFLIKQKHMARLNAIVDEALSNPENTHIALKSFRDREICASWDDKKWHEQALANLDARVAGGEEDKPVIRQKLLAKVAELSK